MTQVSGYHQAIERLFNEGTVSGLSEAQLLERFALRNDESAFAALVERHGPMVLGVCRRFLRDPNDVDDAFQAVFLVLARKAGGLRQKELLGNWLFGVACRVSVRARSVAARRRAKAGTTYGGDKLEVDRRRRPDEEPWETLSRDEGRSWLHEEVERLPRRYRQPVVACYFEGRTHEEAATLLGCPLGTVKGRLSRARDLLRKRLERRGLAVPAVALAAQLASPDLRAAVSIPLVHSAVRSGLALTAAGASLMTTSAISTSVRILTEGALHAMVVTQLKAVVLPTVLVAAGMLTAGATVVAYQDADGKPDTKMVTVTPPSVPTSREEAATPKEPIEPMDLSLDPQPLLSPFMRQLIPVINRYDEFAGRFAQDRQGSKSEADQEKVLAVHRARIRSLLRELEGMKTSSNADRELRSALFDYLKKLGGLDKPRAFALTEHGVNYLGRISIAYTKSSRQLKADLKVLKTPNDQEAARDLHRLRIAALEKLASNEGVEYPDFRQFQDALLSYFDAIESTPEPTQVVVGTVEAQTTVTKAESPKPKPEPEKAAAPASLPESVQAGGGGGGGVMEEAENQRYRIWIARGSAEMSRVDSNPLNQAVFKALENPVTLRSTEKTTLDHMLKQIKDSVKTADGKKIPIYIDPAALKEADKTLEAPVVIDLEDVPLKFSLRLMLKQLNLAYCVRDGVLIISSLEGIHQELMEAESELMGLHPDKFPRGGMGGMGGGGFGGGMGGMGGGQGMM